MDIIMAFEVFSESLQEIRNRYFLGFKNQLFDGA